MFRKVSNCTGHPVLSIMPRVKPSSYHLSKGTCYKLKIYTMRFKNYFINRLVFKYEPRPLTIVTLLLNTTFRSLSAVLNRRWYRFALRAIKKAPWLWVTGAFRTSLMAVEFFYCLMKNSSKKSRRRDQQKSDYAVNGKRALSYTNQDKYYFLSLSQNNNNKTSP